MKKMSRMKFGEENKMPANIAARIDWWSQEMKAGTKPLQYYISTCSNIESRSCHKNKIELNNWSKMCKRTRAKERHLKPILMIISAFESCLARIPNCVEDEEEDAKNKRRWANESKKPTEISRGRKSVIETPSRATRVKSEELMGSIYTIIPWHFELFGILVIFVNRVKTMKRWVKRIKIRWFLTILQ